MGVRKTERQCSPESSGILCATGSGAVIPGPGEGRNGVTSYPALQLDQFPHLSSQHQLTLYYLSIVHNFRVS